MGRNHHPITRSYLYLLLLLVGTFGQTTESPKCQDTGCQSYYNGDAQCVYVLHGNWSSIGMEYDLSASNIDGLCHSRHHRKNCCRCFKFSTTTTTTTTTTTSTTTSTTTTPSPGCTDVHGSCRAAFDGSGACFNVLQDDLREIDIKVKPLDGLCGMRSNDCCECFKMTTRGSTSTSSSTTKNIGTTSSKTNTPTTISTAMTKGCKNSLTCPMDQPVCRAGHNMDKNEKGSLAAALDALEGEKPDNMCGCNKDKDCGTERICEEGFCVPGCRSNKDCSGYNEVCNSGTTETCNYCKNNKCVTGCSTDWNCRALQPVCGEGGTSDECDCEVSQNCQVGYKCDQSNHTCIPRSDELFVQPVKMTRKHQIRNETEINLQRMKKPVKGLCCQVLVVDGVKYIRDKITKKAMTDYGCVSNCVYIEVGDFSFTEVCFKSGNLPSECQFNTTAEDLQEDPRSYMTRKSYSLGKKQPKTRSQTQNRWSSQWMSRVKDNVGLEELSIPGTHDTMTYQGILCISGPCKCQEISVLDQLNSGVRFIDIRLGFFPEPPFHIINNNLAFWHGPVPLDGSLDKLYKDLTYFLRTNPTETIIMRYDNERNNPVQEFCKRFKTITDRYISYIWRRSENLPMNNMPKMGQTRGKIILMPTSINKWTKASGCIETALSLKGTNLHETDNYNQDLTQSAIGRKRRSIEDIVKLNKSNNRNNINPKSSSLLFNHTNLIADKREQWIELARTRSMSKKTRRDWMLWSHAFKPSNKYKMEILNALSKANSNPKYHTFITYVSAAPWPKMSIKDFAYDMNKQLADWLEYWAQRYEKLSLGIVVFDYITSFNIDMPFRIYQTNFGDVSRYTGPWGKWASRPDFCPKGSFVYGFRVKIESKQYWGDDTSLNDIQLICLRPGDVSSLSWISSNRMNWGGWSNHVTCSSWDAPVIGFQIRVEGNQGIGDDTAVNAVALKCKDNKIISKHGGYWGSWKSPKDCPQGKAVIGIQTQVEGNQGPGDDTAVNGVRLYCGDFP